MAKSHDDISNYFSNYSKHFHSVEFNLNQINQCKCLIWGCSPILIHNIQRLQTLQKCFKWHLKRKPRHFRKTQPFRCPMKEPETPPFEAGRFLLYKHAWDCHIDHHTKPSETRSCTHLECAHREYVPTRSHVICNPDRLRTRADGNRP